MKIPLQDSFSLFDPHKFNSRWPPSYQYGDFMIHFMDRPKVNFTEMSRTVLAGTNASLSIPLNETRYIKGDENVANWYEKQAKIPLADRQAMARMGGIGPLYKHEWSRVRCMLLLAVHTYRRLWLSTRDVQASFVSLVVLDLNVH